MNQASKWRLEVARKIAAFYSENSKVRAVIVGGSVSRGWADRYSDLELGVYWSDSPSDAERKVARDAAGGRCVFFGPVETFYVGGDRKTGFKVQVHHSTVEATERLLKDTPKRFEETFFVSVIQNAIPLYGESLIHQWQQEAGNFPDDLVQETVRDYLQRFDPWQLWKMLIEYGEVPTLYQRFVTTADLIVKVVALLSHTAYNFHLKWHSQNIQEMQVGPKNFVARLHRIFRIDPPAAPQELRCLVSEMFDLVDTHLPKVDTTEARELFDLPLAWAQVSGEHSTTVEALQRLGQAFAKNPKVRAVMKHSRPDHRRRDLFSNVELRVFWAESPVASEREAAIEAAHGKLRQRLPYNSVKRLWLDICDIGGAANIQVMHYTVEAVERILTDVIEQYDISDEKQKQDLLAAIRQGIPLEGSALITRWQSDVATFPAELAQKIVQNHLLRPEWDFYYEEFARRDDIMYLYWFFWHDVMGIILILTGLNRIYTPMGQTGIFDGLRERWLSARWQIRWRLSEIIKSMKITPPNLANRLHALYSMEKLAAVHQLRQLVSETLALVETHMPSVNTKAIRERLAKNTNPLQAWDHPPEGLL